MVDCVYRNPFVTEINGSSWGANWRSLSLLLLWNWILYPSKMGGGGGDGGSVLRYTVIARSIRPAPTYYKFVCGVYYVSVQFNKKCKHKRKTHRTHIHRWKFVEFGFTLVWIFRPCFSPCNKIPIYIKYFIFIPKAVAMKFATVLCCHSQLAKMWRILHFIYVVEYTQTQTHIHLDPTKMLQ